MLVWSGKGPQEMGNAFPLVIAAHDHEPYDEQIAGSHVIKARSTQSPHSLFRTSLLIFDFNDLCFYFHDLCFAFTSDHGPVDPVNAL